MKKTVITFLVLNFICVQAQAYPKQDTVIKDFKGDVKVVPGGTSSGHSPVQNEQVKPEDWIVTGDNAKASIFFDETGDNSVKLGPNTIVAIKGRAFYNLEHIDGSLSLDTSGFGTGQFFGVKSLNKVFRADQATWHITSIDGTVYIIVKDQNVIVNDLYEDDTLGEPVTINADHIGVITSDSIGVINKKDLHKGAVPVHKGESEIIERGGVGVNEETARQLEGIISSE